LHRDFVIPTLISDSVRIAIYWRNKDLKKQHLLQSFLEEVLLDVVNQEWVRDASWLQELNPYR
jgi:hypothetical protein